MIQNKKRIISLILMLTLLVSALVVGAVTASAADTSITITGASGSLASDSKSISWTEGNFSVVNYKNTSGTAIRTSDSDHFRLYIGNKFTISGGAMSKVVITCTGSSYLTSATKNTVNDGWTVSTSDTTVTYTATSGSSSELTITIGVQSRVKSVVITSVASSEPDVPACDHTNTEAIGEAKDATCTEAGITAGLKCADCGETITAQETISAKGHDFDRTATGNGRCKNCEFVAPKATFVFAEGENNVIYATNKESHVKAPAVSALTGSYAKEYTFVGWAKMESGIDGETTTAPTLYQPEKYIPLSEDAVFYAVYTYQVVDGNASSEYVLTDLTDIGEDDVVVITMTKGNGVFALPNDKGTDGSPSVVEVDASNNKLSGAVAENILWNIVNTDDGYIIYVNNSTTSWLYCNSSNTGVCVGTGQNKSFVLNGNYLQNNGTGRYLGVYNNSDWRCYTTNTGNSNIVGQTVGFYVKSTGVTTYYVTSLECDHDWSNATCTAPKTCRTCGVTEGEALGHKWSDATCTAPKTCSTCKTTEGEALGHDWDDATCTAPKTCRTCGATEGKALGHTIVDGDCPNCEETISFDEAIKGTGTVVLNENKTYEREFIVPGGVTIDLGGHDITATGTITFDSSARFVGNGRLFIPKDKLVLSGEASSLPVWHEAEGNVPGYYTFNNVVKQSIDKNVTHDGFKVLFRPSLGITSVNKELFTNGANDYEFLLYVYKVTEGTYTLLTDSNGLAVGEDLIQDAYKNGKAIGITITGADANTTYAVKLVVKSNGLTNTAEIAKVTTLEAPEVEGTPAE